jgi:transmembrane sensor
MKGKTIQKILAVVILMATVIWQGCEFRTEEKYEETGSGEKKEVELPGGSTVILNAGSEIGWSPGGWLKSKHVKLKGEAYFKIKKGKRFIVKTKLGTVEVLGTIFNVYCRDKVLEVQCLDGKVQVHNTEAEEKVLLKKGEEVAVVDGWMQSRQKLRFYPVWYKGESTFRDASLKRVFDEVSRQYGVKVFADSIENLSFSGKFSHKDLNGTVGIICRQKSLHFQITGDSVLIRKS